MKKTIFLLFIVIGIVVLFFVFGLGKGMGIGNGKGSNNGDSNQNIERTVESKQAESNNKEHSQEAVTNMEKPVIKISVVGNDYFYENEKMALDELMNTITDIKGEFIVEIKDEQASKNAYESLINELEEKGIEYVEK